MFYKVNQYICTGFFMPYNEEKINNNSCSVLFIAYCTLDC